MSPQELERKLDIFYIYDYFVSQGDHVMWAYEPAYNKNLCGTFNWVTVAHEAPISRKADRIRWMGVPSIGVNVHHYALRSAAASLRLLRWSVDPTYPWKNR